MKTQLLSSVLLFAVWGTILGQKFNRQYVGVAYSPYTDKDPKREWNQYKESDITAQLNVVRGHFSSISTYSMGTEGCSAQKRWDQCNGNALIARVAANMNKQSTIKLTVNIGVHQTEPDTDRAITNALAAAADANRISPNTVWGLTLTNEYVKDQRAGDKVLKWIGDNKVKARGQGLKIGTRVDTCDHFLSGRELKGILQKIASQSDFIYCNAYPSEQHARQGPKSAAKEVINYFLALQSEIKKTNPKIDVIIGETGWPSEGTSFNKGVNTVQNEVIYWKEINSLATQKNVKVQMFEAFDEPWKGKDAESHFGWWCKPRNNENRFVEKEMGGSC